MSGGAAMRRTLLMIATLVAACSAKSPAGTAALATAEDASAGTDAGATDSAVADDAAGGDGHDAQEVGIDAWDDPDAPPQSCFEFAPPGPHRQVTPAAKPIDCPPLPVLLPWTTPDGLPPGPPTLTLELGTSTENGAFLPYDAGQWAPIVHGVQGGIHVWAAFRTSAPPGSKTAKITMDVAGRSFLACQPVATELTASALVHADAAKPGTLTSASIAVAGTPVAFDQNVAAPYCGQWIVMELEVRDRTSQAWGRASVLLRLYDLKNL